MNGTATAPELEKHQKIVKEIMRVMEKFYEDQLARPSANHCEWLYHMYREHNEIADRIANDSIIMRENVKVIVRRFK